MFLISARPRYSTGGFGDLLPVCIHPGPREVVVALVSDLNYGHSYQEVRDGNGWHLFTFEEVPSWESEQATRDTADRRIKNYFR